MRFRNSSSPPYLNKTDQLRMLRMVGILVLVLVCAKFAGNPNTWAWLIPPSPQKSTPTKAPTEKDIDYSVKAEEDSPLLPDAFRSRLAEPPPARSIKRRRQPAIAEASPERAAKQTSSTKVGDYTIEIDPKILAPVSDGWLGIRQHEAGAFFAIIAKAKEIPLKLLEDAGDNRVDYTVLMTDAEQFRGMPLSVEGTIRMIQSVSISREEDRENTGVDHYFVAWMWTESSGKSPYRLICTSLPQDMTPGENLDFPAKFTGYFFKKEGYKTEQGFHVAPVLIGKHIRWNRPPMVAIGTSNDLGLAPYIIGLTVLIALALGGMIWRFNVSDKKFGHQHVNHFTTATPKAIEDLANLEADDPNELFRQLEAEAHAEGAEDYIGEKAEQIRESNS